MLLVSPRRTLWRMATIRLTTFITDAPVCFASIAGASFFLQSHLQVPQRQFCTIPATRFVEDASQVMLDDLLFCVGVGCDLRIRQPLEDQRCDSPLLTGEICVSKQQRHHFRSTSLLSRNLAICASTSQSDCTPTGTSGSPWWVISVAGGGGDGCWSPVYLLTSLVRPLPGDFCVPSTTVQPRNSTM